MLAGDMLVNESMWRKSQRSVGNGACVEVTVARSGIVVRDSTDQSGPMLAYTAESWRTFARSVRLDHLAVGD
jgi:Domain of unknown function (DUF397)